MRILVTGASGFIGSAVASALAADGHAVVGTGRRPEGWDQGCYLRWDLTGPAPATLGTFDAVVHSAALADDWAPADAAMRANRDGTRRIRNSFPDARIVHLSTSSVYDAFTPSVMLREDAALPTRFLSSYSASKAAAERELSSANAAILRPHAVYGPGDTTLLPRVVAALKRGTLALPAGARVRHSLTHIDNLVDAVRQALPTNAPRGIFNIADASPVLLSDVLTEFLGRRGIPSRIVSIPVPVAFAVAHLAEARARVFGGRPRITRYALSQLALERTFDITRAREELGYEPRATSLEGAETW